VILQPAAIALVMIALLVSGMGLYAGFYGLRILKKWDSTSGSELQLELERRTYLISTIMSYILSFELMSLFLFVYTADDLHTLFTGAMCAAGTLAVNSFGYPTLLLKIVNFLLAGVWLIVNHADNRGYDYPLIRIKYELLNLVVPLLVLESVLLFAYFAGVKPEVITSCCGSLFSLEARGFSGDLAALPHLPMKIALFAGMAATAVSGVLFYLKGRAGYFFSTAATTTFLIAAASIVSFICLYFYELPTHHCPFCLLQKEYSYIGYALYVTLFSGAVCGIGVGALMPFKKIASLAMIIPGVQRRLTLITLICYLAFTLITVWEMIFSSLVLS
jgi:hypothetical protein